MAADDVKKGYFQNGRFRKQIFRCTLRTMIKIYFFLNLFEDLMMFGSLFAVCSQVMLSAGDFCGEGDLLTRDQNLVFGNFKVNNFPTDDRYESKIG